MTMQEENRAKIDRTLAVASEKSEWWEILGRIGSFTDVSWITNRMLRNILSSLCSRRDCWSMTEFCNWPEKSVILSFHTGMKLINPRRRINETKP